MDYTFMNGISLGKSFLGIDMAYLLSEWKAMLNTSTILADVWAGLTVTLVALPLNLALAIAAGVEPGVGITTAVIASFVSSLLGGQKYAITGPSAAMAVVLLQISQTYGISAVWLVGIIAGILQYIAGAMRFGKLISYVPLPVIVGFTNSIGVLIIFNSLANFIGISKPLIAHVGEVPPLQGHPLIPEFIEDIISLGWHIFIKQDWNQNAVIIGTLVILIAVLVPKITKAIPGQLIAIAIVSAIASIFKYDLPRIMDIGHMPQSLPFPTIPNLPWQDLDVLFPFAITIFLLGSIESLLSASVADGMTMSTKHHSDQELIGQGIANMVTPLFGGIPVSGAITRTAVNIRAGAASRLATLVHGLLLIIFCMLCAKQSEQIPLAALAGILVLSGFRLIEWDATKRIFDASRSEGIIVLVTTVVSVLMDLTAGVITGLILSCGFFIRHVSAIKVIPHTHDPDRRSKLRQPVPTCKYVRTFLVDGLLFFGAAERFIETISYTADLKAIILHMKAVHIMDLTGAHTLLGIHERLKRKNIRLALAELQDQPLEVLEKIDGINKIGRANIYSDFQEAILSVDESLLQTSCKGCASAVKSDSQLHQHGPRDCQLRKAISFNTEKIADILIQRSLNKEEFSLTSVEEPTGLDYNRLIKVNSMADIPARFHNTPISDLLRAQNMYDIGYEISPGPILIIGMCIDHRKQLHLPKNGAYIIRSPGANMKDQEFSIALALSAGITYMALLVHNKCLMSKPQERKELLKRILVQEHAWDGDYVDKAFDEFVSSKQIGDPISFGTHEAARLQNLFKGLTVVPLLYDIYSDKLFIINESLIEKTSP
jgi:SulP family sulfate permease